MTGYVRKDTTNNIADGNVINAADLDAEFDGVQDAFNASTGHNHDGTTGEGAPITALGPTQDVTISAILLAPKTNNTVDIGSSSLKFKDLFLAGNGSIGGTLAVTGVATLTANPVLSAGTANGVAYLNGSKVVTSGSALTFDGTTLGVSNGSAGSAGISITGTYSGSGSVAFLNFQRAGGAVAGTLGYNDASTAIQFGTTTNHSTIFLQNNAEQMRLTSTGLGIGTSSPSEKLTVNGNIKLGTSGTSYIYGPATTGRSFFANSDSTAYIGIYGSSYGSSLDSVISFVAGTSNSMTFNASGNLGLGVTPSAWNSIVKAVQVSTNASFYGLTNRQARMGANHYYDAGGTFRYISTAAASDYQQWDGAHAWLTAPSGTAGNAITFTQAMSLTAGGDLLVGTTSSNLSSASRGVIEVNGASTAYIGLDTGGTLRGTFYSNGSIVGLATATLPLTFGKTDGTEWGRFDTSGNLLVGTASAVFNSRIAVGCASGTESIAFAVGSGVTRASGTQYGYTLYRDNTTETNAVTFVENGGSGSNASSYVVRTNSGTGGAGVTNVSGGVALVQGATSWSSYSDLRLKHDVVPVTNAIESILKIDPIFFKWNDRPEDQKRSIGVSAQSVEKVFPELIDRSGIYDVEGGAMQVRYTELIPVLLASIQEQQAIINQLKARLDAANL